MSRDLTTSAGVSIHMLEASSEKDWDDRCDQVKAANGGRYPSFWFNDINKSGLMHRVTSQWKKS